MAALLFALGCSDGGNGDDDAVCDDDSAEPGDDDTCDDDSAADDDTAVGDDDSALDPMAPHLSDLEVWYTIIGFGECVVWFIWTVEDPDGDLDGCAIHLNVGDLYVAGTWSNPDEPGPFHVLKLRLLLPIGEDGENSLDYATTYDVELWMQDAAGHASNHLLQEGWESPNAALCSSLDPPIAAP